MPWPLPRTRNLVTELKSYACLGHAETMILGNWVLLLNRYSIERLLAGHSRPPSFSFPVYFPWLLWRDKYNCRSLANRSYWSQRNYMGWIFLCACSNACFVEERTRKPSGIPEPGWFCSKVSAFCEANNEQLLQKSCHLPTRQVMIVSLLGDHSLFLAGWGKNKVPPEA